MSNAVDNFWNELAITQMASGQAPSVKTDKMQKALSGDKEAAEEISREIDVNKAATTGAIYRAQEICKVVR